MYLKNNVLSFKLLIFALSISLLPFILCYAPPPLPNTRGVAFCAPLPIIAGRAGGADLRCDFFRLAFFRGGNPPAITLTLLDWEAILALAKPT